VAKAQPGGDRCAAERFRRVICVACDRAFPHPSLASIPNTELAEARQADLRAWRKAQRWHAHRLRHDVAQHVLGHAHLRTVEIYAETAEEKAVEAMEQVG
jgi:hypothetical protein